MFELFGQSVPKMFRAGTHRMVDPADSLARLRRHAKAMGVTRLGNITGLDRIGIPVAIAVRPNSRSISVAQGKGIGLEQAYISALMEAAESFHGEQLDGRFRLVSYWDLAATARVVHPGQLSSNGAKFDAQRPIHWIEGVDLLGQEPIWVPAEIVHTDYTLAEYPDSRCLLRGSNGLGSGNHMLEALSAAICEVIERDAAAIWAAKDIRQQGAHAVDIGSIEDATCSALIARYAGAGIALRLWDVTSDIGVAAFVCDIRETCADPAVGMRRFRGAGCHPDRTIAACRALTEAAQTRLTYIAGSRDDLLPEDYAPQAGAALAELLLDVLLETVAPRRFADVPSRASDDIAADVAWLLERLRAVGITQVVAVDLTRPALGIPVVRVVIPCLEGDSRNPEYRPGRRATR